MSVEGSGGEFAGDATSGAAGPAGAGARTPGDGRPIDEDKVRRFALDVWRYKQGEMVSLMIHLGDRLGLYRAMVGAGPIGAAQLATRTGLAERWVREWLLSQAAGGLVRSDDGLNFELPPEAVPVLADDRTSLWFAAGAFHGYSASPEVVDALAEAFRSGVGLTYDQLGPAGAHQVERMLGPWTRLALVAEILPALKGIPERLGVGCRVADVGCGTGLAVFAVAEAFPNSFVEGFDPSMHAIDVAERRLDESALTNAAFHRLPAQALPDEPTFDLVMTLDCLHDMAHPVEAANAIRRALRPDGAWLIKEIKAGETWAENAKNPVLAMMYATSVATCMSSALSEPGGAGLGTLGMTRSRAEQMCSSAGFSSFEVHEFPDPVNVYFEVRP